MLEAPAARASGTPRARRGNEHCDRQGLSRLRDFERRAPALWRRGEVQLDRLAAGARARLDGEFLQADSRISAATLSAQLMQTPARSIPQPVQLQLEM
jgi:hypothetical protein